MYDFHSALGQFIVYRHLIQLTAPEYKLYLAIDDITYDNFFQRQSVQSVRKANENDLLAAGVANEEIVLGFQHPNKRPLTEFAVNHTKSA